MASWLEDVAATAKARRADRPEVPTSATFSSIAKAVAGKEMPWATTHDESLAGEQVPLKLAKGALDLAASLRKGDAAQTWSTDHRVAKAGPSFSAVQDALQAALKLRYPPSLSGDPSYACSSQGPWCRDVFDDAVVFEYQGKLYRLAYVFDGVGATLGATPELVRVSYVPATLG